MKHIWGHVCILHFLIEHLHYIYNIIYESIIYICTTVQKFGINKIFFFKEINSFIQQECIKLIKTLSIYNGTRLYFKEMYFQLVIKVK